MDKVKVVRFRRDDNPGYDQIALEPGDHFELTDAGTLHLFHKTHVVGGKPLLPDSGHAYYSLRHISEAAILELVQEEREGEGD